MTDLCVLLQQSTLSHITAPVDKAAVAETPDTAAATLLASLLPSPTACWNQQLTFDQKLSWSALCLTPASSCTHSAL
jgi:hypothetical protein